ncbi:MAG TPA: MarC family protein [Bdellovibrionota bacterium]|jgi:multiple antibiotic resistance protein
MLSHVLTTFVTLFVIIDPIGSVPVFISLTGGFSAEKRKKVANKAILVATGVLLFFVLLGQILFDAIGVRLLSFEIAGGVVLFLFGLKMIFDKPEGMGMPAESHHDVAVFPLAIPSIAGPGAMLGVVVSANNPTYSMAQQAIATGTLLFVLLITYTLLRSSEKINHWIGKTGSLILSRVMGIILTAIATETILKAIAKLSIQ